METVALIVIIIACALTIIVLLPKTITTLIDHFCSEDDAEETKYVKVNHQMAYEREENTITFYFDTSLEDSTIKKMKSIREILSIVEVFDSKKMAIKIYKNKLYSWDECESIIVAHIGSIFHKQLLKNDFDGDELNSVPQGFRFRNPDIKFCPLDLQKEVTERTKTWASEGFPNKFAGLLSAVPEDLITELAKDMPALSDEEVTEFVNNIPSMTVESDPENQQSVEDDDKTCDEVYEDGPDIYTCDCERMINTDPDPGLYCSKCGGALTVKRVRARNDIMTSC